LFCPLYTAARVCCTTAALAAAAAAAAAATAAAAAAVAGAGEAATTGLINKSVNLLPSGKCNRFTLENMGTAMAAATAAAAAAAFATTAAPTAAMAAAGRGRKAKSHPASNSNHIDRPHTSMALVMWLIPFRSNIQCGTLSKNSVPWLSMRIGTDGRRLLLTGVLAAEDGLL